MKIVTSILLVALAVSTSGCANLFSVHHNDFFGDGSRIVSVDAKQRAILVGKTKRTDTESYRQFCAEPAPDAMSALSVGLSGDIGLNALKSDDPEAKLKAALAMSESASTIERTQTINVLREAMYRTCERYLGGAISPDEFIIQAARDQRMIVSVLAIEQLTRAARPPATVISAGGASSTYTDPVALQEATKRAATTVAEAVTEQKTSERALGDSQAAMEDWGKDCNAANYPGTDADKPTDPAPLAAYNKCGGLLDAKDAADAKVVQANKTLTDLNAILSKQAYGLTSTSGVGAASTVRVETLDGPTSADLSAVAVQVADIVKQSFEFPEIQMTCVVRLRNAKATDDADPVLGRLNDECLSLLASSVEVEVAKNKANARQIRDNLIALRQDRISKIKAFLIKKGTDNAHVVAQWNELTKAMPGIKAIQSLNDVEGVMDLQGEDIADDMVAYIEGKSQ